MVMRQTVDLYRSYSNVVQKPLVTIFAISESRPEDSAVYY
jgi:hypothetical protein